MLHHVTSRPYTTQCHQRIEWPTPGVDLIHEQGIFQKTSGVRSFYCIHPDWLSEDVNPPIARGRVRRAWPWEFPGARATYALPAERLRHRMLSDQAIEEEKRRISEQEAYKTQHNSPWYVNDPDLNPNANVISHRDIRQPHTLAHNNARRVLTAELRQPPMRRYWDLYEQLDRIRLPNLATTEQQRPTTADDAARFRRLSNSYQTYCDWR